MRGTIEAFFKTFKRLCRFFAGQSFANVVERGDYPAEQWASLTFEGLAKAAIRFIVDHYHHRKHRGLEGGTPHGRWLELSAGGLPPPPSSTQIRAAFGFKDFRKISKHGILHLNISYVSAELSQLYGKVNNDPVEIRVDPDDLGAILVRIPNPHLGKILGPDGTPVPGHFIEVPSENDVGSGRTLVEVLKANEGVRELAKEEQERGSTFRLDAYEALFDAGRRAILDAGIPSHEMTQKHYELCIARFKQKEKAALSEREYGPDDLSLTEEGLGEIVGQSAPTTRQAAKLVSLRPRESAKPPRAPSGPASEPPNIAAAPKPKPFSGSINLFGEDD